MKKYENSINLLLGILILFFSLPAIGQNNKSYNEKIKLAFAASTITECQTSLKFCNDVLNVVPNHAFANYLVARLNALLGNNDIALKKLDLATRLGYTTKLPFNKVHLLNDVAFNNLRKTNEFQKIIKVLKEVEEPIHKSQIAFTINEKGLVPEGITYDPVDKMFYLGSETKAKIIKVNQQGKATNFTSEKQDGLNIVLGIHVDAKRRNLWVCSYEEQKQAIFKYNLTTGKLIKKYLLNPEVKKGYFNDLVIHPNGDVYISDPQGSAIYLISHSSDKLELFFKNKLFSNPNGITLSENGQDIFIATSSLGIWKINIKTKSFVILTHEPDFSPLGIDGLYFANNKLFAVQINLNQISSFSLNKDATHLEECYIFERNGPYLDKPTTGVIVDDYFYFIADTQGKGKKLEGVIIMKVSIK